VSWIFTVKKYLRFLMKKQFLEEVWSVNLSYGGYARRSLRFSDRFALDKVKVSRP
jgi:hypothetical protein